MSIATAAQRHRVLWLLGVLGGAAVVTRSCAIQGPRLVFEGGNRVDMRDVACGSIVVWKQGIRNDGDRMLNIERIEPSCGCVKAVLERWQIAPGASTVMALEIQSSLRLGQEVQQVVLHTNERQPLPRVLHLSYTSTVATPVPSGRIDFGEIAHAELPVTKSVTVQALPADADLVHFESDDPCLHCAFDQETKELQVIASAAAPLGELSTRINLVSSRKSWVIPVHAVILGDVYAVPPSVVIGAVGSDFVKQESIVTIRSDRVDSKVVIGGWKVDYNCKEHVSVEVECAENASGAAVHIRCFYSEAHTGTLHPSECEGKLLLDIRVGDQDGTRQVLAVPFLVIR